MFSTIVAYGVFILTSIIFVAAILEKAMETENDRRMKDLQAYVTGRRTVTDWRKVLIAFVFWAGSGIYLWG